MWPIQKVYRVFVFLFVCLFPFTQLFVVCFGGYLMIDVYLSLSTLFAAMLANVVDCNGRDTNHTLYTQ